MEYKFCTIFITIVTLIVISPNIDAASTTNGKLLKFYPITKQQYKSILALSRQQPPVPELHVKESHRSLADWSNTLHSSWNTLFNVTNTTSTQNDSKVYPICVIKTKEPVLRRKRSAKQFNYNAEYAGLAPNVVYPGSSYYGRPPYLEYPYYRPDYHHNPYGEEEDTDSDDENVNNDDDGAENEDEENSETEVDNMPAEDDNDNNNAPEKDSNAPIINCVVVVRRNNQITITNPDTENTDEDENEDSQPSYQHPPHPHHPYPYPYPPSQHAPIYHYPPQIPPHGQYPHPYPPHPHPYESSRSNEQSPSRINAFPVIDPVAALQYHEMIAEYYKHLQSFYMADANAGMSRSKGHPDYADEEDTINDDDDDNDKDV